ncbi:MAG: asparagine synthase (glutamine-hydrolyzing) [Pseudomonadota bacterium]
MCGIAGAIRPPGGRIDRGVMAAMLAAIRRRGPDDEGIWNEEGVWLGHRRLSIIDLSAAGHQPMVSACGRYVIVLNGEIYNHRALRLEVEALGSCPWRGRSDCEVLLESIARFGIAGALDRANGMFAFAVWDRQARVAYLARDRFGEKPLYYSTQGGGLTFASELAALERVPGLSLDLDGDALTLFFRYGYVAAPFSVYRGMRKLPPGCLLTWSEAAAVEPAPYWSLGDVARAGRENRLTDPYAAVEELDGLLREAVRRQMMADVPLGAFLSGGIDSSVVVAMMQSISPRPVRTFTLGFAEPEFDEAGQARDVARHLHTDHTEHYIRAADARAIAPALGAMLDEPFADPSQIPTFLISGMAREHVKVCLTGDGGDEMFGGYVRYAGVPRLWKAMRRAPLRAPAAKALERLPLSLVEATLGRLGSLAREYTSRGMLGPSLRRAAGWLGAGSQAELYELTMTAWAKPESLLKAGRSGKLCWRPPAPPFDNDLEAMIWRDSVDYLPGDILCKVDRAAMAHGLETRVPLLDLSVAAFSWRAPPSMKIRGGETKWLLRQVLRRYLPAALIDRPKMGFSVPLHAWLTGDLRDWAQSLLSPALIRRQGVLNPDPIEKTWRRYQAGDSSLDNKVWSLLMFQSWLGARER